MLAYYEVDVPIRNTSGASGWHVFSGQADSPQDAMLIASSVYQQADAAHRSGLGIPRRRADGWGARGYRVGWTPDWPAARTRCVHS